MDSRNARALQPPHFVTQRIEDTNKKLPKNRWTGNVETEQFSFFTILTPFCTWVIFV
jgi:hypothetical protein